MPPDAIHSDHDVVGNVEGNYEGASNVDCDDYSVDHVYGVAGRGENYDNDDANKILVMQAVSSLTTQAKYPLMPATAPFQGTLLSLPLNHTLLSLPVCLMKKRQSSPIYL